MRVSPCPLPSVVASSSYTVSAEGYPDYTANAITSDEAAAAYREAAAGDADGSGNVGGTSTASQTTTVSSNDIASTEHEFLVLGLIPKVKNTITLTITDTDGNAMELLSQWPVMNQKSLVFVRLLGLIVR